MPLQPTIRIVTDTADSRDPDVRDVISPSQTPVVREEVIFPHRCCLDLGKTTNAENLDSEIFRLVLTKGCNSRNASSRTTEKRLVGYGNGACAYTSRSNGYIWTVQELEKIVSYIEACYRASRTSFWLS